VSRCASCREEMREMEQIGKDLRAGDTAAFDPALKARILAGMPSGTPDPASARRRRLLPESRLQRMYLYGGLAAGALCWVFVAPSVNRMVGLQSKSEGGSSDAKRTASVLSSTKPMASGSTTGSPAPAAAGAGFLIPTDPTTGKPAVTDGPANGPATVAKAA